MNENPMQRRESIEEDTPERDPLGGALGESLRGRPASRPDARSKRIVLQAARARHGAAARPEPVDERGRGARTGSISKAAPRSLRAWIAVAAAAALLVWGSATWNRREPRPTLPGTEAPLPPRITAPAASAVSVPSPTWDEEEALIDRRIESAREWAASTRSDWLVRSSAEEGRRWRRRIDGLSERTALLRSRMDEEAAASVDPLPPASDSEQHSSRPRARDSKAIKEA